MLAWAKMTSVKIILATRIILQNIFWGDWHAHMYTHTYRVMIWFFYHLLYFL